MFFLLSKMSAHVAAVNNDSLKRVQIHDNSFMSLIGRKHLGELVVLYLRSCYQLLLPTGA